LLDELDDFLTTLDDEDLPTLEEPTEFTRLLEDIFLLELDALDPFDFTDVPLRVTLFEDKSSFTEVPLSSPQATRHNVMTRSMDPIALEFIPDLFRDAPGWQNDGISRWLLKIPRSMPKFIQNLRKILTDKPTIYKIVKIC
jgi:hypothetical protein